MAFEKAQRKKIKLKLGIFGPSGSGKTFSALKMAKGLAGDRGKIAVLDTENGSASLYTDLGGYDTQVLKPPFSPERYVEYIAEAYKAGYEVLIIDSISHERNGSGGILDKKESMTGNDFTKWSILTKEHNRFWNAILQVPMHVIVTGRTKEEYSMFTGSDGRIKIEKAGTNIVQRDGVEYELTLAFTVDIKHNATSSKDRTGLFMDKPAIIIDEAVGEKLKKRCDLGIEETKDDETKTELHNNGGQNTSTEV